MPENQNSPWWKPDGEWAFAGLALTIFLVSTGLAGLITALRQDTEKVQALSRGLSAICALIVTLIIYRRWKAKR